MLPYVYLLAVYARYDSIFRRLDWRSKANWRSRAVVKAAVMREFGLRARDLAQMDGAAAIDLARRGSWAEARAAITEHRKRIAARQAAAEAEQERLIRYAEVVGVDEYGRQLDRREFEMTQTALRWLHNCHMGWWRREERYHTGLLDTISSPVDTHGLLPDAGFHEHVAEDGHSWYAWRRTVTGWVFAIGANGRPPNQWTFDGPEPPNGPPGEDPTWGSDPFASDVSRNW